MIDGSPAADWPTPAENRDGGAKQPTRQPPTATSPAPPQRDDSRLSRGRPYFTSPRRGEVERVYRARVRGFGRCRIFSNFRTPSPQPSPLRGEGARRVSIVIAIQDHRALKRRPIARPSCRARAPKLGRSGRAQRVCALVTRRFRGSGSLCALPRPSFRPTEPSPWPGPGQPAPHTRVPSRR